MRLTRHSTLNTIAAMVRRSSWTMLLALAAAFPLAAQQPAARPEVKDEPLRPEWCRQLPRPEYRGMERVAPEVEWFEIYRVRPGVFALYEPRQYEEVISYLIVGSQRVLLFDTGIGVGDIRAAVGRLTSLPVTGLNSHSHFDHTGGNHQFREILGMGTTYTRHNARGATPEQMREAVLPERFCGAPPKGFRPGSYRIHPFHVSRSVKDGEVIDLGDRKLEVLLTPGHTPDSLSLLDRASRLLFTGDTFYPGPLYLYVPETDVAAYERSIDRLAGLVPQLDLLLTGHNVPTAKPEMLTRVADALRQVRAGKAQFVVQEGRREYRFDGFSLLMAAP